MLVRLLRRWVAGHPRALAAAGVLQVVQTAANLLLPALYGRVVDHGIATGDTSYITRTGALLVGLTLVATGATVGATYLVAQTAAALGRDLRADVFAYGLRGGLPPASLVTRTTSDVTQVQTLAYVLGTLVVPAPLVGLGALGAAVRLDGPLAGVLLVAVPVLGAIVVTLTHRMRPGFRTVQRGVDRLYLVLREQLAGVRVNRAYRQEAYEHTRFVTAALDLQAASVAVGRIMALLGPAVLAVTSLATVAVLALGGPRVVDGSLRLGELVALIAYVSQVLVAVLLATAVLLLVPRAAVCAERIGEVLAPPRAPILSTMDGELLTVRPGEFVAVVGGTGSGKSTLLRLAAGRLPPSAVGLVPQQPYLFTGTVATNLRYGHPDATDAELWHALDLACARDFVTDLAAEVTAGGGNLSGGQRQRLTVARALLGERRVLLLDDPFAALDALTAAALRDRLVAPGRAVVVATQRVSTIRTADRIVVLEHGRVVGVGTHDELLTTCAVYCELSLVDVPA